MATSSSTPILSLVPNNNKIHSYRNLNDEAQCSFLHRNNFPTLHSRRSPNKDVFIRRITPEVAGEVISSNPLSSIPFIGDNPLLAGICGLAVGVPLMIQRLVAFTKTVEAASQTVEKIADTVENIADEVDKAAEGLRESLPEGKFKELVTSVEKFAEHTSDGADKVSDLMDKVQELEDKLEDFVEKGKKKNVLVPKRV